MDLKKEQAKGYIEEAILTLESAKAIFDKSSEERPLWAQVIKSCYDSMEQAVSSAIAFKGKIIPKEHPAKITRFIELFGRQDEVVQSMLGWLGKRAKAQYIDIVNGEISIPSKIFNKEDAILSIKDAERVLEKIKKIIV